MEWYNDWIENSSLITLPPMIKQGYDPNLLRKPTLLLRNSPLTLARIMEEIEMKWKKFDKRPAQKIKAEQMKQEFMELYERTKAKEEERKEEATHFTQRPFYRITSIDKKDEEVLTGLSRRRICRLLRGI